MISAPGINGIRKSLCNCKKGERKKKRKSKARNRLHSQTMDMSDSMGQTHGGDEEGDPTNEGGEMVARELCLDMLPEDCISAIISLTSPRDACVVASVSSIFNSAAKSDFVWVRFLPPEYLSLVPGSWVFLPKKEIYLALSHDPVLIDDGKKSFWLDKPSGKKCYMFSAMDISITWGDTPEYWQWISDRDSRFERVAELQRVCWFEIRGRMSTRILSPGTHYSAYIVFKRTDEWYWFNDGPVRAGVGVVGSGAFTRLICFDAAGDVNLGGGGFLEGNDLVTPENRGDGWMEVGLGEFFNNGGGISEEIEINVLQNGAWKRGLIIQGIEIRPREDGDN